MKLTARFCSPAHAGSFVLTLLIGVSLGIAQAQNEPILVPDAVDYQKLLPILPQPPQGWTADKPEGSTENVGGFGCMKKVGSGMKFPRITTLKNISMRIWRQWVSGTKRRLPSFGVWTGRRTSPRIRSRERTCCG